jgi:mono/diheme cytochrome c family protein
LVFLRSVPPAHSDLPPAKIPFVFGRLVQTVPQPLTEPVPEPDRSTPAKYGAYLVKMATCSDCHTPLNPKFQPIPGMEMAGGNPMEEGVNSANITPDPLASGITTRRYSSRPCAPARFAPAS